MQCIAGRRNHITVYKVAYKWKTVNLPSICQPRCSCTPQQQNISTGMRGAMNVSKTKRSSVSAWCKIANTRNTQPLGVMLYSYSLASNPHTASMITQYSNHLQSQPGPLHGAHVVASKSKTPGAFGGGALGYGGAIGDAVPTDEYSSAGNLHFHAKAHKTNR